MVFRMLFCCTGKRQVPCACQRHLQYLTLVRHHLPVLSWHYSHLSPFALVCRCRFHSGFANSSAPGLCCGISFRFGFCGCLGLCCGISFCFGFCGCWLCGSISFALGICGSLGLFAAISAFAVLCILARCFSSSLPMNSTVETYSGLTPLSAGKRTISHPGYGWLSERTKRNGNTMNPKSRRRR